MRGIAQVPSSVVPQGETLAEGACIRKAVAEFSVNRPRRLVTLISADGLIGLSDVVTGWNADQYRIEGIEIYGADGNHVNIEQGGWIVSQDESGAWTLNVTATTARPLRLLFTAPHVVASSPAIDTIATEAPSKVEAVAWLAASFVLDSASIYYARVDDSSLMADSRNYGALSGQYRERAKDARDEYLRLVPSGRASGFASVQSVGGRNSVFHQRWQYDVYG